MADRRYTRSHEWVMVDGKHATIGITDYAQSQLGDQRLELEDRLERALAGFGLVGGVGGVELGLGGHGRHRRRDEAAVDAAAAKRQPVGKHRVPIGQGRDLGHRLELGQTVRQLKRFEPQRWRDVDEKFVHRPHADRFEHRRPVLGRVDEVGQATARRPRSASCKTPHPEGRRADRLRARASGSSLHRRDPR